MSSSASNKTPSTPYRSGDFSRQKDATQQVQSKPQNQPVKSEDDNRSSLKSNISKCPGPFELAAYRFIKHSCETKLGCSIDFNEFDASKTTNVGDDLLKELNNAFPVGGAREFLQRAAKGVGKSSTGVLGTEYKVVEFDFVAHINEPQPSSTSTAGGDPSAHSAASPDPKMPIALQIIEVAQKSEGEPPSILAALVDIHLCPERPFVTKDLLTILPRELKEKLIQKLESFEDLRAVYKWVKAQLKGLEGRCLELSKEYRTVSGNSRLKKDSPKADKRKVVLWEIKENSAVDYALVQLERRIVAYTSRRRDRDSDTSLKCGDCIGLVGIHVQDHIARSVEPSLNANREHLPKVWEFFEAGLFQVTSPSSRGVPDQQTDELLARKVGEWQGLQSTPTMGSPASQHAVLELYFVRVVDLPGQTKEKIINITPMIKSGEVTSDISGLQKAVLKEFPNTLQGKDVGHLTVSILTREGEKHEEEELEGHIPLKKYPSDQDDKNTFFICKIS